MIKPFFCADSLVVGNKCGFETGPLEKILVLQAMPELSFAFTQF